MDGRREAQEEEEKNIGGGAERQGSLHALLSSACEPTLPVPFNKQSCEHGPARQRPTRKRPTHANEPTHRVGRLAQAKHRVQTKRSYMPVRRPSLWRRLTSLNHHR